nr:MAG TPA: hypothetical protein [Caudoviricetes sp.]
MESCLLKNVNYRKYLEFRLENTDVVFIFATDNQCNAVLRCAISWQNY